MKLIAGVFDVEKPYFSLDSARFYRRLGVVRHRGLELSFVGNITPRLNVLTGAILLDARVLGEAQQAGLIGLRPVGAAARTFLISGEYRPPGLSGFSVDAAVNAASSQAANSLNTLSTPGTQTLNLGARYRWQLAGKPLTIRVQASNLLNAYSWQVQASNAFFYNNPRQLSFRLSTDL
jgi:iron complex outermembrane receptor protein